MDEGLLFGLPVSGATLTKEISTWNTLSPRGPAWPGIFLFVGCLKQGCRQKKKCHSLTMAPVRSNHELGFGYGWRLSSTGAYDVHLVPSLVTVLGGERTLKGWKGEVTRPFEAIFLEGVIVSHELLHSSYQA